MTHPSELEFDENSDNVKAAARILELSEFAALNGMKKLVSKPKLLQ